MCSPSTQKVHLALMVSSQRLDGNKNKKRDETNGDKKRKPESHIRGGEIRS